MSAKQGNSRNKIDVKKLCVYALFTAAALVFSYVESILPLYFIAPGVKLGLSNAVSLLLAAKEDFKGAFAVNGARIMLSALLFGSPVSFAFAISGGIISLISVVLLKKTGLFSTVGISIAGGVVHNITQIAVAVLILGGGVLYYTPVLLITGALCGAAIGALDTLILKKVKTNGRF